MKALEPLKKNTLKKFNVNIVTAIIIIEILMVNALMLAYLNERLKKQNKQ